MYSKNVWEKYESFDEIMDFNEGYKKFITNSKTERLCVINAIKIAEENGFKPLSEFETLKTGDKVYVTNKGKNIALFVIGEEPIEAGLRVLGAHIDSPRLDVKQNPLFEKGGFAMLDTHYYGGIKKYQFVATPLAIYGVVCKKDGTVIDVNIGDKPNDPVVGISDLLIHLSASQMSKPASSVIEGKDLDVTVGSIPLKEGEEKTVKANILKLLKDTYDFEEEDFLSAELEVVPAGEAKDYGLDRSMVGGYGHDDRVCGYTSMMAVIDGGVNKFTSCAVLVDKEEVGSIGATGAQSKWFENTIAEMIALTDNYNDLKLRRALTNTKMLSSDVAAGFDPLFPYAFDTKNNAFLGKGLCIVKYTGSRGKGGANDAMPEYIAEIRKTLDDANVYYQTSEIGEVDVGGGGTIAYILGNTNMNVIDAGIAVLAMHSPFEIVSKADVYEAYVGYKTFLTIK